MLDCTDNQIVVKRASLSKYSCIGTLMNTQW